MKRILICSTILVTVKAFLIHHIRLLQNMGYRVDVAGFKDTSELDCVVDNVYDITFQRTPFSKFNIIASHRLKEIVRNNNYDMIHFHTPVASAFGRWAVKEFRNNGTKVFYTAHGFHFFKGAPLKNWLIYYPVEKFLARYTDVLITINKEDYLRAKRSFRVGRVEYIPGVGLDTKKFYDVVVDKLEKRKEIGIPEDAFVVLSVGELNKNKNHETFIKAVAKLNNSNVYYVICGEGSFEKYLRDLINKLGLESQVKLLGFRRDIAEICKVSDVFAFPSKREGLGLAALEAMASGLPIITSNVHGIVDYSIDGITGFTCNPTDVNGFTNAINYLIEDEVLKTRMGENNAKVVHKYDVRNIKSILLKLYEEVGLE